MHRTSSSSTRNSLGFVKYLDDDQNNDDVTLNVAFNSAIADDDVATLLDSSRIQREISSVVLTDDMLSLVSSSPSELCAVDWKRTNTTITAPRRIPRVSRANTRLTDDHHRIMMETSTSEDLTETTLTARSLSDVVEEIVESSQITTATPKINDENCRDARVEDDGDHISAEQSFESALSIASQHERQEAETADLSPSIEQITSHFQLLSHDDRRNDIDHDNSIIHIASSSLLPMVALEHHRMNLTKPNETELSNHQSWQDTVVNTMSLDRTYHESRLLLNTIIDESIHSDSCWTEEECGTATSSDFMVLPVVLDNNVKHCSSRKISQYYQAQQQQQQRQNHIESSGDNDDQSCGSSNSSSSGCTIHLSIRSCQSSVTWYEGSNIDEIDITLDNSDHDDETDSQLLSSNDPEVYSTYT